MQSLKDSFDPSKFISDKCECLYRRVVLLVIIVNDVISILIPDHIYLLCIHGAHVHEYFAGYHTHIHTLKPGGYFL